MRIEKLPEDPVYLEDVRRVNDEAFPPEDTMTVEEMLAITADKELFGFYEGDAFVGFAFNVIKGRSVYIALLAMGNGCRDKGYGTQALRFLADRYKDKQVSLDFEELLPDAENYAQRVSRKRFYLRNGFKETGRYTVIGPNRYEVACLDDAFDACGLAAICSCIHEAHADYQPFVV